MLPVRCGYEAVSSFLDQSNCPGALAEEGPMLHVGCGYEAASSSLDQSNYALCVPLHVSLLTRYLEGRGA